MGVDAADVDGDGRQDLFVANVDNEMSRSIATTGTSPSRTRRSPTASARPRGPVRLGLKLFDFDNDGQVDLFLANGHPDDMVGTTAAR